MTEEEEEQLLQQLAEVQTEREPRGQKPEAEHMHVHM